MESRMETGRPAVTVQVGMRKPCSKEVGLGEGAQ